MNIDKIEALKDSINDYVFDHWDTLGQDPEHLEYETDNFQVNSNGNPSCNIKFPDDNQWYTIVEIDGKINLF